MLNVRYLSSIIILRFAQEITLPSQDQVKYYVNPDKAVQLRDRVDDAVDDEEERQR